MKTPLITACCFASALLFVSAETADDPKPEKKLPAHEVSLEVQALRSFYELKLTEEQLKFVAKLAKETAEKPRRRKSVKVSEEYDKVLRSLRDALSAAEDDQKIDDLEDEIDKIADKPDLDDSFDITKAARKRAPEVLMRFSVSQLADCYGAIANDLQEPEMQLTGALSAVRGLEDKEWTNKRDEIADEIAWSVAGLDVTKADKIRDKVVVLLSKAHALDADEFKAKKAELEKEAKALVGEIGPDTLLRHDLEHILADMLSNPRLEAAINSRLK